MLTPYQFARNSPIYGIDFDGLEIYYAIDGSYIGKSGTSTEIRVITNAKIIESGLAKKNLSHSDWNHDWLKNEYHSQKAYTSPNQAAVEWAFEYQGKSHATPDQKEGFISIEYGAMIGSKKTVDQNGRPITLYLLGNTVTDRKPHEVDVLRSEVPKGWAREHAIHTHPGGKGSENPEEFSPYRDEVGFFGDEAVARSNNLNLYLGTPRGHLKVYDYKLKQSLLIYDSLPSLGGTNGRPSFKLKFRYDPKTNSWPDYIEYPKYSPPNLEKK
ncbi:MAG: hypothetical protein IPM36_21505 [Lewinellaceae bacterium]|nr:hypothetical protein [Lewinellaceae bacterium]